MRVLRQLADRQSHRLAADIIAHAVAEAIVLALAQGRPATQVRQLKSGRPVPAIGVPEQGSKRLILAHLQLLAFTRHPPCRRKTKRENANFSDKWIHRPSSSRG